MLKIAASLLAASLAWTTAGSGVATPPAAMNSDAFEQQFNLKPGESAPTQFDPAWRIGFEGVTADSRCPKGVHCVWAGEATVRVWLQRGTEARQLLELTAGAGAAQVLQAAPDLQLRLERLDPYPVAGRPIAADDYRATLLLRRTSNAH